MNNQGCITIEPSVNNNTNHTDHLGTPQVITDSSQQVVWSADYEPFGQTTLTTQTVTYNQRFPGQYFDAETGLHYNYFRDYDPSTGRYIQSDPIGLRGGVNTFGYVGGNPLIYIDTEGKNAIPWDGGAIPWGDIWEGGKVGVSRLFNIFATCLTLRGDTPQIHRGRIQAQSNTYEDSESWSQSPNPPTVANGLAKLDALVKRMPKRFFKRVNFAIEDARKWILKAGRAGGVNAQAFPRFQNPGVTKGERIDIEVIQGRAFVP